MAAVPRRRRLGSDAWRSIVDRHPSSGLTVETYCSREGVSTASFYRWRAQLSDAASLPTAHETGVDGADSGGSFLDIGGFSRHAPSPPSSIRFLLQVGSLRLQLERG